MMTPTSHDLANLDTLPRWQPIHRSRELPYSEYTAMREQRRNRNRAIHVARLVKEFAHRD